MNKEASLTFLQTNEKEKEIKREKSYCEMNKGAAKQNSTYELSLYWLYICFCLQQLIIYRYMHILTSFINEIATWHVFSCSGRNFVDLDRYSRTGKSYKTNDEMREKKHTHNLCVVYLVSMMFFFAIALVGEIPP